MNNYLIMDAISCLDTDLLADHLKKKNALRMTKKNGEDNNAPMVSSYCGKFEFVFGNRYGDTK